MRYKHVFSICAYKDSPYLESCIRSLLGQRTKSHVILCTSTPSIYLTELARAYDIPMYAREGESNIRDDWNFAYHMADGDFVTIAHQDDVYHKDYAAELLRAAERWPDMTVFTSDYVIVKNGKLIKDDRMLWVKRALRAPLRLTRYGNRELVKKLPLVLGNSICCPACSYQKRLLGEPLFQSDYQFALDWESLLCLAGRPGRFVCAERPLLYYRVHDGATTKACIEDNRREREEREMFARIWPEPVARLLMKGYKSAYEEYQ